MWLRNIKVVNMAYKDEKLQEMEFGETLYNNKRSFFRMYWAYIKGENVIINDHFLASYLDLKLIISFYFLALW